MSLEQWGLEMTVYSATTEASSLKPTSLASCLLHEFRAVGRMVRDSLLLSAQEFKFTEKTKTALILPGFGAPPFVYNSLKLYLRSIGIFACVGRYGVVNLPNYRRQIHILRRSTDRFRKKFGRIDYIIGHSLGGIEAVALLPQYNKEIVKAIAVASPFNEGTPWRIVELGASLFVAPQPLQGRILKRIVQRAKPFADKIVTVSSIHDRLVPPDHAQFPGATNIVIDDSQVIEYASPRSRRKEEIYHTHTGITNSKYVRENILRALLEV